MRSVLIANRGEIAVRVVRACRELGLRSVAVYSEADRCAPHVLLADEAWPIGATPSAESYLRIDRILEAATRSGAEAIHPGYGFLAERADFAREVEGAGLIFVGPRPDTIAAMGDKVEARRRMSEAGVPVVPGSAAPVRDPEEALSEAEALGFPVILKAAAGGGGKGMRTVYAAADLPGALAAAGREAQAAFGDAGIYLERYLERPRHVEVQILGDGAGRLVHLGERECSIQRRHQKLIEEAPAPELPRTLRDGMTAAALRAGRAVDYRGAGTVEFLVEDGAFWFLEMNTRIQVEHPVTELVTGVDLVRWQLRIAAGEPLDLLQEEVEVRGHAIECRITAEDPFHGFLPSTGVIRHLEVPGGPGVRWDAGVGEGSEVGLDYDPLLAKLVVHAPDRAEAVVRMARALDELVLDGVRTSAPLLRRVMDEGDFRAGHLTVRYLEEHPELMEAAPTGSDLRRLAAVAALLEVEHRRTFAPPRLRRDPGDGPDPQGRSAWSRGIQPREPHR